jgi:hypothetical protein
LLLVLFFVLMKRYFQLKQEDAESETAGKDKKTSEQAVQSEAPSSGENANEKTIIDQEVSL